MTAPAPDLAPFMIGTAGHIDHGKSSLVRALTGIDPDRLPDEKERGMTIDLGFAPLRLPSGRIAGMIDVPGHERLLKNMVAGATSVDLALLVVDAGEGVMPQTREHLDVLRLLGLTQGLLVLTKIDAVDEETALLAEEDVRDTVRDTFLEGAPLYRTSAKTGAGLPELVAAIERASAGTRPTRPTGPFRMPIQRVFSAKGFGAVVTGVPISGSLKVGDEVELLPLGERSRVRGVQSYRMDRDRTVVGASTALNLADLDYRTLERGMVACAPGAFLAGALLEASVTVLARAPRPLRHLEEVRVHIGTAELLGKLAVLEGKELAPGETGKVQVRLREDTVAAPGDRFILRRQAEQGIAGGGVVLGLSEHRLKGGKSFVLEALRRKEEALADPSALLAETLRLRGPLPMEEAELAKAAGLGEKARPILAKLAQAGTILLLRGKGYLHAEALARAEVAVMAALDAAAARDPLFLGVDRRSLPALARLDPSVCERAVEALLAQGLLRPTGAREVARSGRSVALSPEQQRLREKLLSLYEAAAVRPPAEDEVATALGIGKKGLGELRGVLRVLEEDGALVHAGSGLRFARSAFEGACTAARALFAEQGPFTASAYRERLDTTRKHVIPLLEHMDRLGITVREGDLRRVTG